VANAEVEEGDTVTIDVLVSPESGTMPDLTGLERAAAEQRVVDAGFEFNTTLEPNDEVEANFVIGQSPAPNEEVPLSTTVDIIVSTGPDSVTIPDLRDQTEEAAINALQDLDLRLGGIEEEPSADIEEGRVIRTEPAAESQVTPDSPVTLFVSSGLPVSPVPQVVNLTEAAARERLQQENFNVDVRTEGRAPGHPEIGFVVGQDPAAGSEQQELSTVTIIVAVEDQSLATTTTEQNNNGGGGNNGGGDDNNNGDDDG
jgi:serine/threonine-protein kinase